MTKGSFGYKIGRKIRLMEVDNNVDLFWQILVREIYVLIKHYNSIETLQKAFENLKEVKNMKPTTNEKITEKCKPFSDIIYDNNITNTNNRSNNSWPHLLRWCQHSYINILESGYFLNNGDENGIVFLLDFNTKLVKLYKKIKNISNTGNTIKNLNSVTIEEIMEFEEMPTKTLEEITNDMYNKFNIFDSYLNKILEEKHKIQIIIDKAKELGGDYNIIQGAQKLMEDMDWEEKKLKLEYRVFYNRLDALDLIDHYNK